MHPFRTHNCGELRKDHAGSRVRLSGWVFRKRDHGHLLFFDVRDHYGLTQIVLQPDRDFFEDGRRLRMESVITVTGQLVLRSPDTVNPEMPTGEVELVAEELIFESVSEPLPLAVDSDVDGPEDTRLRYRYLDLRRSRLHSNIVLRSKVIASIRRRMTEHGFMEFQTPILTSSSPEGARDYLVPSRIHPGMFYALPQAPQQFKQLLMVAGFDRYFQIAPCFRDEDARADRSPGEFYQLDLEMSFATQDDVFAVVEDVFSGVFSKFARQPFNRPPFPRLPYALSMERYGTDKPDLRVPIEMRNVTEQFRNSGFKIFSAAIDGGAVVRALPGPGAAAQPRSFFDKLVAHAQDLGSKGLAYLVWANGNVKGPLTKFLSVDQIAGLSQQCGVGEGDALFFLCDRAEDVNRIGADLRLRLGQSLGVMEQDAYRFCWIVDFPMFEKDPETGAIGFSHNPFSMPQGGLQALQEQAPMDVLAYQYDIVCNGLLLAGEKNIREVITFPMNQKAQDLMMGAPCEVSQQQLRELHIKPDLPPAKPTA
ncbi:MAG: aspartate--tRNA ligase [Lentisphaerae bacterium]|nr:aspartate--tRNA ligase [Lentisphaerota bacterium]